VRLEGLVKLKNPMISSRIETATFWLVAQRLNQLRYRVSHMGYLEKYVYGIKKVDFVIGRFSKELSYRISLKYE
jgi:hypothetical protein